MGTNEKPADRALFGREMTFQVCREEIKGKPRRHLEPLNPVKDPLLRRGNL
jgi:hypothetical protein